MNNKSYTLDLSFNMFRLLENNEGINTIIVHNYRMLTIPSKDFIEVLDNIEIDFNKLIEKYTENYHLKINDS